MMQKDFKIGLVFGAICLLGLLVWLATNKSLSPNARLAKSFGKEQSTEPCAPPVESQPVAYSPAQTIEPQMGVQETFETTPEALPEIEQVPAPASFVGIEPNMNAPEDPATEPTSPKIKTNRFHIVQKGETLSGISQAIYGTARRWPQILEANKARLEAPEKIRPGMYLIIPE